MTLATYSVGDVITGLFDGPHATPAPSEDGPVFLGIRNITEDGRLDLDEVRHIAWDDFPNWTKRVEPREGDLVFTYEASLHRYALIPPGFKGCLGRRTALIRSDPERVDARFLLYYFLGPLWKSDVAKRINIGSTVDRIPLSDFPRFPVHLPSLVVQRKVTSILAAYDELIENNLRRIAILEETAAAVYREWFGGVVDAEASASWPTSTLGAHVTLDKGLSYKGSHLVDHGRPMISLKSIRPQGGFDPRGIKPYDGSYKPRHAVAAGDLVVANTDLTQAGNVIGSPALLPRQGLEDGGLISHHLFVVRVLPESHLSSSFLFQLLASDAFRSFARGRSSGTTVLGLRREDVLEFEFRLPPVGLVESFNGTLAPILRLAENLAEQNTILRVTRDLLLPRLVGGKVDVSELDIDTEWLAA